MKNQFSFNASIYIYVCKLFDDTQKNKTKRWESGRKNGGKVIKKEQKGQKILK